MAGALDPFSKVYKSTAKYNCIVENCEESFRGDRFKIHFEKCADIFILDQAVKMGNIMLGEEHIKTSIDEDSKRAHTIFLLKEGYSSNNDTNLVYICKGFKDQLKSKTTPKVFENFFIKPKKVMKIDEKSEAEHEQMEVESDENIEDETNSLDTPEAENKIEVENQIMDQIKDQIGTNQFSKEFMDELALKIATKVVYLQNLEKEKEKEKQIKSVENNECWKEYEDSIVCHPCFLYSRGLDVPKKHKKSVKGSLGIFNKANEKNVYSLKKDKAIHCNLGIHGWCVNKLKNETLKQADEKETNRLAGRKVIRNALFCFVRSYGAEDFLALNEKDSDLPDIATKNDSRNMFFKLRNIVFDVVSEKTINYFKDVKYIAVSLDKVTVKRTSFTVITTYFFHEGKLHVILNKLEKMKNKDEYTAHGTAQSVINTLKETLGFSDTKLALVLKHFVYDGVYATTGKP